MTDRTCGGVNGTLKCAWWTHNAEKLVASTLGWCHEGRMQKQTECGWWCRHHATTRGWGEDDKLARQFEEFFERAKADADYENKEEIARLKARCQEAREILTGPEESFSTVSWHAWRRQWLETSDDA